MDKSINKINRSINEYTVAVSRIFEPCFSFSAIMNHFLKSLPYSTSNAPLTEGRFEQPKYADKNSEQSYTI